MISENSSAVLKRLQPMKLWLVVAGCMMSFFSASLVWADIEIVSVQSFGEGRTESEAIKSAQIEAIGQVSGEILSAATEVTKESKAVTGAATVRKTAINQSTESLIKGVIKATRVTRVTLDKATGLYRAEIMADVARLNQSDQLKRKKMVVVSSSQISTASSTVLENLRSALESALVASRKVAVLDRKESASIEKEIQIALSEKAAIEERLKAWNMPTADLMVLVTIMGMKEFKDSLENDLSQLDVKVTVVDPSSRQLKYQKLVKVVFPGMMGPAAGRLAENAGGKIAKGILDFAFPIVVISVSEDTVIVSAGDTQLQVGQEVKVYQSGKALKDPYTGEMVGTEEHEVASGKVVAVYPAYAKVSAIGFSWKPSAEYIVRKGVPSGAKKSTYDENW